MYVCTVESNFEITIQTEKESQNRAQFSQPVKSTTLSYFEAKRNLCGKHTGYSLVGKGQAKKIDWNNDSL